MVQIDIFSNKELFLFIWTLALIMMLECIEELHLSFHASPEIYYYLTTIRVILLVKLLVRSIMPEPTISTSTMIIIIVYWWDNDLW